ncbi:hypothetical protein NSA47_11040 [Irregularibacter muris]|uniref:Uncharacterized protein n=1 Tax=Irregularibacter muris TaxID=1796619 RepID=A0AAE3L011_9FIRM|nr:hypothetical protein [Irregularibacter muris]MCR1899521.1 hypothetical protein [Irregularibacter muris]
MGKRKHREEYPKMPEMDYPMMPDMHHGMYPGMCPDMMPGMHPGMMPGMTMHCYCVPVPCSMHNCPGMMPPAMPMPPQDPCMGYPTMPAMPNPHHPCMDSNWGMMPAMPAENYPMMEDMEEDYDI